MIQVKISPSTRDNKKFMAIIEDSKKKTKRTVHFGQKGSSDYTINKDKERKQRYLDRHRKREDWTKKGINTAGFLSRWLLWNKPTLEESIKDVEKRFNINILLS